jgi:hypothetical protein
VIFAEKEVLKDSEECSESTDMVMCCRRRLEVALLLRHKASSFHDFFDLP